MATKNQTAKQVAKKNNINIGDKITFVVGDTVLTEEVTRINEKSITATRFARSGFDYQQSYRVFVENILAVRSKNDRKLRRIA